jgi:hypothetical protein
LRTRAAGWRGGPGTDSTEPGLLAAGLIIPPPTPPPTPPPLLNHPTGAPPPPLPSHPPRPRPTPRCATAWCRSTAASPSAASPWRTRSPRCSRSTTRWRCRGGARGGGEPARVSCLTLCPTRFKSPAHPRSNHHPSDLMTITVATNQGAHLPGGLGDHQLAGAQGAPTPRRRRPASWHAPGLRPDPAPAPAAGPQEGQPLPVARRAAGRHGGPPAAAEVAVDGRGGRGHVGRGDAHHDGTGRQEQQVGGAPATAREREGRGRRRSFRIAGFPPPTHQPTHPPTQARALHVPGQRAAARLLLRAALGGLHGAALPQHPAPRRRPLPTGLCRGALPAGLQRGRLCSSGGGSRLQRARCSSRRRQVDATRDTAVSRVVYGLDRGLVYSGCALCACQQHHAGAAHAPPAGQAGQ